MPIDPERWTNNTKAAFSAATGHAASSNNPEMTPAHLLDALLPQHETMTRPLLTQVGVDPDALADTVREQLNRLPRAQGGAEPGLSREARNVLEAADEIRRDLGDDYVSVEHLLLALADEIGVTKDALLTAPAGGAGQPPGDHRPTPSRRTRRWPSTGATSPRPPARASSTRSSGATRRSGGSSRSCRGAPRTTRC